MGGGSTDVEYSSSPEQSLMFNEIFPLIQNMVDRGQSGRPAWNVRGGPSAPTPGSAQMFQGRGLGQGVSPQDPNAPGRGVYSGVGNYQIPNAVAPTSGWFDNMAPEVTQGMWEPYNQAGKQMLETMGGAGQAGAPGAGYSGAAGTAMGRMYADAGNKVGLQAWQMQQPGLMANWQANLAQGAGNRQQMQQERLMDWQGMNTQQQQDYAQGINTNQLQNEAIRFPHQMLPGMMGGTYPQGIVQNNPGMMGMLGQGMMGGGMGYMGAGAAGMQGNEQLGMGGLMGLGSMFGGK